MTPPGGAADSDYATDIDTDSPATPRRARNEPRAHRRHARDPNQRTTAAVPAWWEPRWREPA